MKPRAKLIPPPGKARLTEAPERVITFHEAWGKKVKAPEWLARLAKPSEAIKPQP